MLWPRFFVWALIAGALGAPLGLSGQVLEVNARTMSLVMPQADRFGEKEGRPPVFPAYVADDISGEDRLVGYVFLTPDVPPERVGYSGPIAAVVGLDLEGRITGVRVLSYYESYMSQMGDFLRREGFQEQYAGKHIRDPFLVRSDVQGISRATVSSRALSRGVRDAARRVAAAYLERAPIPTDIPDPATLSWLELLERDVVRSIIVGTDEAMLAEISVAHIDSWATGEHLVGPTALAMTRRALESRGTDDHVMVYGVDGPNVMVFSREGWSVIQGPDTFALDRGDVFPFGLAGGGLMEDEVSTTGALILPAGVAIDQPFVLELDLRPTRGVYSTDYSALAARTSTRTASAQRQDPAPTPVDPAPTPEQVDSPSDGAPTEGAPALPARGVDASAAEVPPTGAPAVEASPGEATPPRPGPPVPAPGVGEPLEAGEEAASPAPQASLPVIDFRADDDETLLAETLAGVSWLRTGAMAALLVLVSFAFVLKNEGLRWATLAVTLGYLGFFDGGFLSVSHITSGLWVGASAFLSDLPLLLIASFTVLTTLIFGRVFCGFLCPFGALQDFLTKFVPKRWQRRVPPRFHRPGLWIKYGVLALIVIPALLGSHVSLYQYFEPFGTVFFLSPSVLLWTLALGFIGASAVVPRFYCRYACPLGAALALGSLVALKRIDRVEQCTHCKVCEQDCPTGAIQGADINFKECVRCNICEVRLIEKAGVCQHDMSEVRTRLVQLQVRPTVGGSHAG